MKRFTLGYAALAMLFAGAAQADVVVSGDPTSNMKCVPRHCKPTAADAVLNVSTLQGMLAASDVIVQTSAAAPRVVLAAPLTWTSAHVLTFMTAADAVISAPLIVEGPGGFRALHKRNTIGRLVFTAGGRIDFWDVSSELTIATTFKDQIHYTLVDSLAALTAAANGFAHVALTRDYDAAPDGTYTGTVVPPGFFGAFEGLNHTVSNLRIDGPAGAPEVGMFANAALSVSDIHLANVAITAAGGDASAASGQLVGALAGGLQGEVLNASASGQLATGPRSIAGGLVGQTDHAVTHSSASVTVTAGGSSCIGGLVGSAGQKIVLSHATGDVAIGGAGTAGGLVGCAHDSVLQSFATGNVSAAAPDHEHNFGGLVGSFSAGVDRLMADSYATGTVNTGPGRDWAGGLIGDIVTAPVNSVYTVGNVVSPADRSRRDRRLGALIGHIDSDPKIADAYFDTDTSDIDKPCGPRCTGVTGLSDAELKSGLPAGFDPAVWGQAAGINNGYPYLLANPPE